MASKLALVQGHNRRHGSVINSIFVSTANRAVKLMESAGHGERWKAMDHLRCLVFLTLWLTIWAVRTLMDLLPTSLHAFFHGFLPGGNGSLLLQHPDFWRNGPSGTYAIGRALSHILEILNKIPATSRKYEFVLTMADRILNENVQCGHVELLDINRDVLSIAFTRTCELLRRSLQSSHASEAATATWPLHVIHQLPLGSHLATCYNGLSFCLGTLFPTTDTCRYGKSHRQLAIAGGVATGSHEWLGAEKLAHELLWITNKMRACSGEGEAIVRWGFAEGLASLSLTAHPRVQGTILKISAMLLRDLARGEWEAAREVRFGILALWLPLFCYASNGMTCPVLTGMEKWEMERVVEQLISELPWEDQEIILGNWVEDFAASDSDWPNLQRCFDRWCRNSRKLLP